MALCWPGVIRILISNSPENVPMTTNLVNGDESGVLATFLDWYLEGFPTHDLLRQSELASVLCVCSTWGEHTLQSVLWIRKNKNICMVTFIVCSIRGTMFIGGNRSSEALSSSSQPTTATCPFRPRCSRLHFRKHGFKANGCNKLRIWNIPTQHLVIAAVVAENHPLSRVWRRSTHRSQSLRIRSEIDRYEIAVSSVSFPFAVS